MKIYESKIDWWLIVLVFGALLSPIYYGIIENDYLIVVVFAVISIAVFFLFRAIKYKIDNTNLIIGSSKIDINSIRKIYKTKNPLSSPALSIDRIAIVYNKYDEVLISPKDKKGFVDAILQINSNIIVEI
jgi:hypothetical protein